jgi:hypothetical protein
MEVPSNVLEGGSNSNRRESEGDVVFYIEEPKAGIVYLFLQFHLQSTMNFIDQVLSHEKK